MSEWNTDISSAPRGKTVTRYVTHKNGKSPYDEFVRDDVILASKCGKVIKSYWIPDEHRFAGFRQGEAPTAWMPWPQHPGIPTHEPAIPSQALGS